MIEHVVEKYFLVSTKEKNIGDTKLELKTKLCVVKRGEDDVEIQKSVTKIEEEDGG